MKNKPRIQTRLGFKHGNPLYDELAAFDGDSVSIRAKIYTLIDLGLLQYRKMQNESFVYAQSISEKEASQTLQLPSEVDETAQKNQSPAAKAELQRPINPIENNDSGVPAFDLGFVIMD